MPTSMPDIAHQSTAQTEGKLDWVGMSNIEMPIILASQGETDRMVSAHIDAFVDLKDPQAKGIHMSRLYLLLDELSNNHVLSYESIVQLLDGFVSSHEDLSDNAKVVFSFDYHLRRKSLVSGKVGWKAYPIIITGQMLQGEVVLELNVDVGYSSTCPCSAALARQLIQQAFQEKFGAQQAVDLAQIHEWLGSTEGIVATPHSQRSSAQVKVKFNQNVNEFPITALIDAIEDSLQTPVQAAVKRIDEQEFARLNGQNLMFCEDAARRLQHTLNLSTSYDDFWLKVSHLESLHAHNAVSSTAKGIAGGYQA